jgi:hypothetical protein
MDNDHDQGLGQGRRLLTLNTPNSIRLYGLRSITYKSITAQPDSGRHSLLASRMSLQDKHNGVASQHNPELAKNASCLVHGMNFDIKLPFKSIVVYYVKIFDAEVRQMNYIYLSSLFIACARGYPDRY